MYRSSPCQSILRHSDSNKAKKGEQDLEKTYSNSEFIAKLRRLADCLENGEPFEIQIANERIHIPMRASHKLEHQRDDEEEEIEFRIKWKNE